ncbi:unnamed protein product [Trichobilharzia szidati]|nr:unnamed protein product [Trichobilharzia szidati]
MYLLKSSNSGGGIFTTPIVVTTTTTPTPTTTSSPHRQILLPPVSTVHLSSSSTSSSSSSSASLSQSINSHDYCTEAYFTTNESSYDIVIRKTIQDVVTNPGILLDEQINVTGVGDGGGGGGRLHKHNTIISSSCSHHEGIEKTDVGGGGGGCVTADNLLFDDISAAIEAINEANRLNSLCTDDIDDNVEDDVIGGSIDTTSIILQQQQQEQTQNVPTMATLHPVVALSSSCSTSTSSCLDQFITHSMFVNIPMTNITTATTTTMPSIIDYHQSPGLLFTCNNNNNDTHAYIQIEKKQDSLTNTSHVSATTTTTVGSTSNITSSIPSLLTTTTLPLRPIKNNTPSLLSLSQSNWRFLLRPIFEKIIIEKLWTSGELGGSNPYSLLLSMWFFISRYFGIGCRTDHAKLAYGNIVIDRNTETGERYLRFTSLPHGTRPSGGSGYGALRRISKLGKELPTFQVKPRHPDTRLLECQSQPDRCPVRLYEAFCSHRPCSTTTIHSPFYLQPDRAAAAIHYYHHNASSSSYPNSSVWFTLNALGKNKIGSMLNGALQSIGMPVGRQVNLTRFCDSLIAAVFSLQPSSSLKNSNNNSISGGDGDVGDLTREACRVSETLRSIILNCRLIIPYQQIPESIQPTISSLAEKVVQLSATRGSPFNNYLAKLSTLKKSVNNKNNGNKVIVKKTNVRKLGKVSSKFLFPSDDDDCSDDDDEEDDAEGHQNQETTDPNNNNHQQQHQLIVFTDNLSHSTVNTNHHHNITSTGTTNSTSTEMNIDNHRPLKSSSSDSSLPTMVPMSICFNSKHIDGCYSDHPSLGNGMDDDDDIDGDDDDDVGIDAFDLNQADLSLNNLHNNQIRTGIGTTNNVGNTIDTANEMMNNNNKGGNYCLTNGKISPSIMQENINLGITQNFPFGNIIQTHGQTLIDLASGQLFQLQPQHSNQQQQQQLLLNNSTEFLLTCPNNNNTNGNINGVLGNVNISSSLSPTVIFVPATTYNTATAQNNRMELTCGGGVGVGVGGASSSTSPNQGGIGSSISAALPLDESMIDISRLGGIENLMPSTAVMFSSSTPIKQSSPECITPQCLVDIPIKQQVVSGNGINNNNNNNSSNRNNPVRCRPVDDIRIDLRKTGGGSGRSVKLELRELLDLVLTSASHSPNPIVLADSGKIYTPHPGTSQRPPVGLVTQLLWRARALDDRGPWILTFSMWWLMQHYFGIGSRMHHVRLRWGHIRLVSGVIDPMTGELCDAIEYVGPPNFTTVKACALPEINPATTTAPGQESSSSSVAAGAAASGSVIRRVYPSSGWAEPEITVATALSTESKADRPRVRPLDTDPSVPPVPPRSGPDFVALYKSFARHRQEASLLPDSPFYVQPLQNSSAAFHSKSSIAWFSIGALGKNRIGALMRNIVDKVVRPDMPKVATAALSAATSACVIAADRAALALPDNHCVGVGNTKIPSSDLSTRQQALVDKLSCLLGTNMSSMMMTTNTQNDVQKININTNSHNNNNNTSTNNSASSNGSNAVIISRLDNPETNVLLLSPSSSAGVVQQQQALPTTITSTTAAAATDIMRSPNHFLLKVPKLVTSSATNTIINTPTTNNISLSSMIAPLSTSPPEPPAPPQVLRNQIVYETSASSIQQAQQSSQMQCPSLVFTQQPYLQQQQQQQQQYQQQQQQTFIQDTATTTFLLLTTVDGQTFLAPAGGCFGGFNNNNANNNNNNQSPGGYILLPTATSTATHSTNIVTPGSIVTNAISQIEHTDVVQQQSPYGQYHHPVQSSINMPMLIYGSGGGGGYSPMKGQNMVVSPYQLTTVMGGTTSIPVTTTTTTTTTTTSAITRSLVTPRTFQQQHPQQQQQPIAYHLTSNPTSSNNSLPVNVILLSNNSTSTSSSTSPILLSNCTSSTSSSSNTPAVVHSQSIHLPGTIYQTENRCDIDFSMYSARETSAANTTTTAGSSMPSTVGLVDSSFQPLIIQRNDSNMATVLLNTNSDSSPVRRTITLMNSGNPLTVVNNNNNSVGNIMTLRSPVVALSSSPSTTTTTTTTSVLPACNQILCGRSSLQQPQVQPPQQQHQQTQPTVLFDTSTSSVSNTTNSMTNGGTAATALLHLSPMKTSGYHQQSPSNSLIQALSSCGQLIAITQPIDGESVVGGSVLQPVIHHNQMLQQQRVQQHQLINSSSDLITGGQQQHQQQQPTITILPISNNTTAISNNNNSDNNSVNIVPNNNNGINNNGIKSDLYFELPMIDGGDQNNNSSNNNNNNAGQTVYRLLCTDNSSDRMLLTNNITNNHNNNEISRLVFVHTTNNQNNNSNNNSSLSETMNSIFTTENSLYPPATLSSTLPPTSSSTTPPSMITSTNDHHFLIDHFPSVIINQQQQQHQQQPMMNGGYSSLASPQPSVSSSFSSSASSSSASSMISMKTTSSGVGSKSGSLLLVSTANPTISSSILQSSKISLLTTSKLKKDQDNVDTTTTTTTNNNNSSNNANCTTSVMMNSPHLLNAGYFIKGDDNQYLRPSPTILTIMTISPTKREQQFNNDMSNNNSINNNNNNNNKGNTSNNNNNFLSTLPPLSSMTCYLIPIEPKPEQLKTLQSVINSASAFQCSDFPAYVEQLFRKGILSGLRPWCLNFTAWFINTLVFEVENRTEHVSLRWGDFRLCKTADGRIEYIYFINRITNKRYYLASSPTSCCALGYNKSEFDNKSLNEPPVRCPCPVTIFKALRDRRPSGCLDPYSKFYLQPRNVECPEANAIAEIHDRVQKCHLLPAYSNWFTEHAWGKNKLGGLFAEASRLAGLPTIWLRKHRSRNFFPGGGGSGIGALGNHLHHQEKKKKTTTATAIATTMATATVKEGNNNNNENSSSHQFTSTRENDIGNDDDDDDDNGDCNADDDDGHGGGGGGEKNHFDDDDDDDGILDPGDDHTSRSKENNNDDDDDLSTHTEVKRRRILNTVQRSTTNAISLPATTNSTTFIYNQQEGSCITTATGTTTATTTTNSVNILPSSMTILKPKEIIYTSTINQ